MKTSIKYVRGSKADSVRGARWGEFDLTSGQWRLPAAGMEMRADHVIPLSRQTIALVKAVQSLTGGARSSLVFPSTSDSSKPLIENTLNSALARMGYKNEATAHGFRALFSTVANEAGGPPDVIERQLIHAERNQVRAAYDRPTYMAERSRLMQWWADRLDGRATLTTPPRCSRTTQPAQTS